MDQFRAAILAALGHAPDTIEPGKLQRFTTNGRRDDAAGWCQMFADGRAGVFGCWRSGASGVWTATDKRVMTPAQSVALARQIEAAARERDAARRAEWAATAGRLAALWASCVPVNGQGAA